jgi:hypothetical protein
MLLAGIIAFIPWPMMLLTLIKRTFDKKKFTKESTNDLTITPESINVLIKT